MLETTGLFIGSNDIGIEGLWPQKEKWTKWEQILKNSKDVSVTLCPEQATASHLHDGWRIVATVSQILEIDRGYSGAVLHDI